MSARQLSPFTQVGLTSSSGSTFSFLSGPQNNILKFAGTVQMSPHSSANTGLTLLAPGICFPMLAAWRLRQVRKAHVHIFGEKLLQSCGKEVTCDITGTEAEILSQIRRYQKNAAVKSTAGSEQGEGDDFEVNQRYYLTQI